MYTITKEFHFSASHQLTHLPPEHQCARLHGHNYIVEVELCAPELDADGFVLDYGALKEFQRQIDTTLDHRHLNEVLGSAEATTAEALAQRLCRTVEEHVPAHVHVAAVRVRETPKTCAEYRP